MSRSLLIPLALFALLLMVLFTANAEDEGAAATQAGGDAPREGLQEGRLGHHGKKPPLANWRNWFRSKAATQGKSKTERPNAQQPPPPPPPTGPKTEPSAPRDNEGMPGADSSDDAKRESTLAKLKKMFGKSSELGKGWQRLRRAAEKIYEGANEKMKNAGLVDKSEMAEVDEKTQTVVDRIKSEVVSDKSKSEEQQQEEAHGEL